MPRTADPATRSRWVERIERQKSSGLTIARFCEIEGVSQVSFHAWKRRLAEASATPAAQHAVSHARAITPIGPSSHAASHARAISPIATPAPPAFLPVRWSDASAIAAPSARVELDLPNGVHLRILDAPAEFVGRVVQLVGMVDLARGGEPC